MSACLASFLYPWCCKFSQEGWGRLMICSRSPSVIKPCFAGYLKLYQLQNPQITDYDCILVDEAQDLTPGDSTLSPFPSSYSQSFLFLWISLQVDVHFIPYPRDSTIMISFHPMQLLSVSSKHRNVPRCWLEIHTSRSTDSEEPLMPWLSFMQITPSTSQGWAVLYTELCQEIELLKVAGQHIAHWPRNVNSKLIQMRLLDIGIL